MKYVFIYCEGQTEESFVNNVLGPYFQRMEIYVTPIIHKTSRTPSKSFKGGVSTYGSIKKELQNLCHNPNAIVTMMLDYYGMPNDTPLIQCNEADIYQRAALIETAIAEDIRCDNFIPNLIMHEFEGLLFSEPQAFTAIATDREVAELQKIRDSAETPEHINNSPLTAPSKRIKSVIENYYKVRQGTIVAKKIGVDKILAECKHFANWIEAIKTKSHL